MKAISGKEFAKILVKKGWKLKKINGSHHIFTKEGKIENISVPIHSNNSLKKGLLNYFIKIADLTEKDLN